MNRSTGDNSVEAEALLQRADAEGPEKVLGDLFTRYRERLSHMVRLRLDRRLRGRIDSSDVLQEAYLEALQSFPKYLQNRSSPFYLWLRCITARKVMDLHRYHLGAHARDARREVNLYQGALPEATSEALAAQLLGQITSPSEAAVRAERLKRLQEALNQMPDLDREILALRYFEHLTNAEAAQLLGVEEWASRRRHLQALRRLKSILKSG